MSLRKVDPDLIVRCRIMAVQAGLPPPLAVNHIEAQILAGGDAQKVVLTLIIAQKAGIPMSGNAAVARDLPPSCRLMQ